ncbi:helix-turn-helix domain-containing protein [Winogradskyella bathintestinalis]|uniref:AraC family transcriptional regulator n=1 Tax=Winogradskyella bathintestinalis TaxID=3035208 RepID=A0ABT7ZUX1_9FLAO|nr:AraC family transcriptional regulator [Winogradskyella bathintestinalis]MDN3492826.1 AraC family transcriptional regulator [Winogradskyella bathintestinalis]
MKLFLKFDFTKISNVVLQEKLNAHNLKYQQSAFGEIELLEKVSAQQLEAFNDSIKNYGIYIIEDAKNIIVQKIKDAIMEMVFSEQNQISVKTSVFLSEKLNQSYSYLSNLFSEVTFTSIENYVILQKIEYTKTLLIKDELSLTEIAYKLNYSSVAHLSKQFKNTTGITPSAFQRIILKRKEIRTDQ